MLRVLVVDDSPTARQVIAAILGSDPEIEVVGIASDGREAVEMARRLQPDVITMDIRMPGLDGFEATKEIMIDRPTPIVIVSASTAVNEVDTAMKALRAGALTLHHKPLGPGSPEFDRQAQELIDTVKAMAEVQVVRHHRRPVAGRPLEAALDKRRSQVIRAVGIAASTGGPPALNMFLSGLPPDFPLPILLVQHIATGFVEGFAAWLNSVVPLTVKIAGDGETTRPGTVYVAPQDYHLGVSAGGRIKLSNEPPVGGFRPAATCLFQSMASVYGANLIALILTGMGRDGVDGLRSVRDCGGVTIAQDEQTCAVFGMPGAAVAEGLADAVLPIDHMAAHVLKLIGRAALPANSTRSTKTPE